MREVKTGNRKRLLMYSCYLLAVLLFFELMARLSLALLRKTWGPVVPPQVGQFDPQLGWKLRPDTCARSKRTGRLVEYCINSKGLRDDEASYDKPHNEFRIVLLGDSRSFGFGVPEEQHFARILEGYFKDLDIINMGVDGYGVDQELLMLRQEGFRYQPDLVMAYVAHFRDKRHMKTKVWGVAKPRIAFANDGSGKLVVENQPVENSDSFYVHALALDRKLASFSKLYQVIRDLGVHLLAKTVEKREEQARVELTATQKAEQERLASELAAAIVLEMARECRERDIRFLLITAVERLHDELNAAGVPVLNVTRPLDCRAFPLPDELGHFNEAGNGAFAWELAQFLMANQLVPSQHVPDTPPFNHMDPAKTQQVYDDTERSDHAS